MGSSSSGDLGETNLNSLQAEQISDEYILLAPNVMEFLGNDGYSPSKATNLNSCSQELVQQSSTATTTIACKNIPTVKVSSSQNIDAVSNQQRGPNDEVELVLLPSAREAKICSLATKAENTRTKCSITTTTPVSGSAITINHTLSNRKDNNNAASKCAERSSVTVLNRVDLHSVLKKQPVIVATKKLLSEVTQTTAKVSIGNTTISVPLLKPINSTKLMQSQCTTGETKCQLSPIVTPSPQKQSPINISKLLNLKRGQKLSQPTIVSLSQLHIKPINNAKIVQAKVVNKKIPLTQVFGSVANAKPPANLFTITASKNKLQYNQPQQNFQNLDRDMFPCNSSITETDSVKSDVTISGQVAMVDTEKLSLDAMKTILPNRIHTSEADLEISQEQGSNNSDKATAISASSTSSTPLNIPKQTDKQQPNHSNNKSNLNTAVNVIMQSNTKLITTTAANSAPFDINFQGCTALTKTTTSLSNSNEQQTQANTIISFPKSISLLLTKDGGNQSPRHHSPQLTAVSNNMHEKVAESGASKPPSMLHVTHMDANNKQLQSLNAFNKEGIISIAPSEFVSPRKNIRKSPSSFNLTEYPCAKRTKLSNETEVELSGFNISVKQASHEALSKHPSSEKGNKKSSSGRNTPTIDNSCDNKLPSATPKADDQHNVLLKQLLQNNSIHNSALAQSVSAPSMSTQVIPVRKVINVRAPSLGLVSSLEAQLARPVIPPVPANDSKSPQLQTEISMDCTKNKDADTENMQNSVQMTKPNPSIISKETSFVSNPEFNLLSTEVSKSPLTLQLERPSQIASAVNKNLNINTNSSKDAAEGLKTTGEDETCSNHMFASVNAAVESFSEVGVVENQDQAQDEKKLNTAYAVNSRAVPNTSVTEKNDLGIIKSEHLNFELRTEVQAPVQHPTRNKSPKKSIKSVSDVPIQQQSAEIITSTTEHIPQQTIADAALSNRPLIFNNAKATQMQAIAENCNLMKDIESRKKRRREYQKHRRQYLNNKDTPIKSVNTTVPVTTPYAKKRAKKFTKVEEDYDKFIENLMVHVRQMQPLQVLEPLLNKHFGICNLYGNYKLNHAAVNYQKKTYRHEKILCGAYGNGYIPNLKPLYNTKRFCDLKDTNAQHIISSIQNNFYDQEFSPVIQRNNNDKVTHLLGIIRNSNVDALEIIGNKKNNHFVRYHLIDNCLSQWNNFSQFHFPGLTLKNSFHNQFYGPFLPVIPPIAPLKSSGLYGEVHEDFKHFLQLNKHTQQAMKWKLGKLCEKNGLYEAVILSVSLSAYDNLYSVLKGLARILQISAPNLYKVIDLPNNAAQYHLTKDLRNGKRCKEKPYNMKNSLEKMLNGTFKVCHHCGHAFTDTCVRIRRNYLYNGNKSQILFDPRVYFCSKNCFLQNKWMLQKKSTTLERMYKTQHINDKTLHENVIDNLTKNCRLKYFKASYSSSTQEQNLGGDLNLMKDNELWISPTYDFEDTRQCVFCNQHGDGAPDGPSRLLNFEVDKWVHLNCALWSNGVYETISGGLMNFSSALRASFNQYCTVCQKLGATVKCFKNRCNSVFHLPCALKEPCVFYKNKTIHCQHHATKIEKENELNSLIVTRRVFVERDENVQVASVMHTSELKNLLRIGSLTFLNVGQLLPHQLEAFHTVNHIYPIGYKIVRFYWSMKQLHKRCRYICSIAENAGHPEFRIQVHESREDVIELRDKSPKAVWQRILEPIAEMRKKHQAVQLFPEFITGEDLFGLTEPSIVRIIESLPGIESLTDYHFKYGRSPLLELPPAVNPSGAARSEPKQRQLIGWRKSHTQRTSTSLNHRIANSSSSLVAGEVTCPYSKQFVHSKSSQYKKMKQEWRNNVYLARSKIQGLGLYAARDIEKHTMIIEYIGEVIRTEVSEIREKLYESRNRGIYMFRLDEDRIIDATLSGGLARYINHSCNPNCVTEIVEVDRELRIIIFAKRRLGRGEELSYDYKFDFEDDARKIPCLCGAPNCRKWMN